MRESALKRAQVEWSPQQLQAIEQVQEWLSNGSGGVFKLFGYAGTGKTTLLQHLLGTVGDVRVAAYTGKAAQVLRNKGCAEASTIHSMIYRRIDSDDEELRQEYAQLKKTKKMLTPTQQQRLCDIGKELRQPAFVLNRDAFREGKPELIALDEVSMIDEQIAKDLLSFKVPLLAVGDPGQLPPPNGHGYLVNGKPPDVMLTEIHRQAWASPIIRMATLVRQGEKIRGSYGVDGRVSSRIPPEWWLDESLQLLCGRNLTRRNYNSEVRRKLGYGDEGSLPVRGGKLVCLRNNHKIGLLNGSLWRVLDVSFGKSGAEFFSLHLRSEDDGVEEVECLAHKRVFVVEEDPYENWDWHERLKANEFDYGYALTVSQGAGLAMGQGLFG